MSSRFDTLRATRQLARCSREQLSFLMQHVDEAVVPAGYEVARAGDYCSQFVIVADGSLKAFSTAKSQRLLEAGDSVGWQAMWERAISDETVVAQSEARLLIMSHAQFRAVKSVSRPPVPALV